MWIVWPDTSKNAQNRPYLSSRFSWFNGSLQRNEQRVSVEIERISRQKLIPGCINKVPPWHSQGGRSARYFAKCIALNLEVKHL